MSENEQTEPHFRAYATFALIIINALVFCAMAFAGADVLWPTQLNTITDFGAVVPRKVFDGEAWRILSALFVHAAIWHVAMNMWVLAQVGSYLESVMGHSRFLMLYFFSGIAGFSTSIILNNGVTCGASGAVFGVVGGLAAYGFLVEDDAFRKQFLTGIATFVAATCAIGFAVPFIDNSAHIGGLVAGFALGYPLMSDSKQSRLQRLLTLGVIDHIPEKKMGPKGPMIYVGIAFVLFAILFVLSVKPVFSPRYHVAKALTALKNDDTESAKKHAQKAQRQAPNDGAVLILIGRLENKDAKAHDYVRAGLERFSHDPKEAFAKAMAEFGDGLAFYDAHTESLVCDILTMRKDAQSEAHLLNACAWFWLDSDNHHARSSQKAHPVAERALMVAKEQKLSKSGIAAIQHTLATAEFEQGNARRAQKLLEEVLDKKWAQGAPFEDDLDRFKAHAAQKK